MVDPVLNPIPGLPPGIAGDRKQPGVDRAGHGG